MNQKQIIGSIMAATGKSIPNWSRSIGYSKAAVYATINGFNKSTKIRSAVCKVTDLSESEIWPERSKNPFNKSNVRILVEHS